jgi:hypothetical protein
MTHPEILTESDYNELFRLFSLPGYTGYKPEVLEAPNGDGKVDATKRYLHVALKYNPPEFALRILSRAHFEACRVAEAMGVLESFYPKVENGTLRVLDYPIGSGSAEHTDFDLFTVHCYRSTPEDFVMHDDPDPATAPILAAGRTVHSGLHIGDIGAEIGLAPATRHSVPERAYAQQAIVYFAMPANGAIMPNGMRAIDWISDRYARSRVYQ